MKKITETETTVFPISKNNKALRTQVPAAVRDILELSNKDTLNWEIYIEDEEFFVILKKQKE